MKKMSLFDWLKEITYKKSDWDLFEDKDKDTFNPYMIHRFLSMNEDYVELVNYIQTIPYTEKGKIYKIYKNLLPKDNRFLKYTKSGNKKKPQVLIEHITKYFECSTKEADNYITLLKKEGTQEILSRLGVEEKESKKLVKEIK